MGATISQICSGTRTSTREVGASINNDDIWDTYVHVPGAGVIIDKPIEAMFHNGFDNFELDYERKLELEKAIKFRDIFGVVAIIVDGDNIQAWNLKVGGIGFTMTDFDSKTGECTEITIYNDPNLTIGVGQKIIGRDENFFLLRTPDGLGGERGLSKLLNLVDVCRINFQIFTEYGKYAKHQGLAHPVLKITDLDDEKFDKADAALNAPTKDDAVIIDMLDEFEYYSPMKQAYDPVTMLKYGDTYVTRESSLNILQIYGDPTGALAASDTATSNWYAHIKELQDILMPSIKPILLAMGAPEDVKFNEPGEYNIATMMNGVLQIRMALDGLVPDEQIVEKINLYLGYEESKKLRVLTKEEKKEYMDLKSFSQNPRGENNNERENRTDQE